MDFCCPSLQYVLSPRLGTILSLAHVTQMNGAFECFRHVSSSASYDDITRGGLSAQPPPVLIDREGENIDPRAARGANYGYLFPRGDPRNPHITHKLHQQVYDMEIYGCLKTMVSGLTVQAGIRGSQAGARGSVGSRQQTKVKGYIRSYVAPNLVMMTSEPIDWRSMHQIVINRNGTDVVQWSSGLMWAVPVDSYGNRPVDIFDKIVYAAQISHGHISCSVFENYDSYRAGDQWSSLSPQFTCPGFLEFRTTDIQGNTQLGSHPCGNAIILGTCDMCHRCRNKFTYLSVPESFGFLVLHVMSFSYAKSMRKKAMIAWQFKRIELMADSDYIKSNVDPNTYVKALLETERAEALRAQSWSRQGWYQSSRPSGTSRMMNVPTQGSTAQSSGVNRSPNVNDTEELHRACTNPMNPNWGKWGDGSSMTVKEARTARTHLLRWFGYNVSAEEARRYRFSKAAAGCVPWSGKNHRVPPWDPHDANNPWESRQWRFEDAPTIAMMANKWARQVQNSTGGDDKWTITEARVHMLAMRGLHYKIQYDLDNPTRVTEANIHDIVMAYHQSHAVLTNVDAATVCNYNGPMPLGRHDLTSWVPQSRANRS